MSRFIDAGFAESGRDIIGASEQDRSIARGRPEKEPKGLSLLTERLRGFERSVVGIKNQNGEKIGEQRITRKKLGKDKETKEQRTEERSEFVNNQGEKVAVTTSVFDSATGCLRSFRRENGVGNLLMTAKIDKNIGDAEVSSFDPKVSEVDPVQTTEYRNGEISSEKEFEFVYCLRNPDTGWLQKIDTPPKGELPEGVEKFVLSASEHSYFSTGGREHRTIGRLYDRYGRPETEEGEVISAGRDGQLIKKETFNKKYERPDDSTEIIHEKRQEFRKEHSIFNTPDSEAEITEKRIDGRLVERQAQDFNFVERDALDAPERDMEKLRFVEAERARGRKIWLEGRGNEKKYVRELVREEALKTRETFEYDSEGRLTLENGIKNGLAFTYGKKGNREPTTITVYEGTTVTERWRLLKKGEAVNPEEESIDVHSRIMFINTRKYVKDSKE